MSLQAASDSSQISTQHQARGSHGKGGGQMSGSEVIRAAQALVCEFELLRSELLVPFSPEDVRQTGALARCGSVSSRDSKPGHAGRGSLRIFAQQVVEKVSQKGVTTYQDIADELIEETQAARRRAAAARRDSADGASKRRRGDDAAVPASDDDGEKNVRRRVYDSLNVLKAIGAITPQHGVVASKEIVWVGLPAGFDDASLATRLAEQEAAAVAELESNFEQLQAMSGQYKLLCQLIQRNIQSGGPDASAIQLPFTLLQTSLSADVEVNVSPDEQVASFDFAQSPFQIVEDYAVLEQMALSNQLSAS